MFFRTVGFFLTVLVVGLGINYFAQNPGEVNILWYGWHIKTSAAFLVFLVTSAFAFLGVILRFFLWAENLPKWLQTSHNTRKKEAGLATLGEALQALLEANPTQALMLAEKAQKNLSHTPAADALLTYVYMQHGNQAALGKPQAYFTRLQKQQNTKYFGLAGELQQSLLHNNSKQALTYAEEMVKQNPKNIFAYNALVSLLLKEGLFKDAEETAEKWYKNNRKNPQTQHNAAVIYAFTLLYTAEKEWVQTLLTYEEGAQQQPSSEIQEKAIKQLEEKALKAQKVLPQFIPAALFLSQLYLKKYPKDVKALKKAQATLTGVYAYAPLPTVAESFLKTVTLMPPVNRVAAVKAFIKPWPKATTSYGVLAKAYLSVGDVANVYKTLDEGLTQGESRYLLEVFAAFEKKQNPNGPGAIRWLEKALATPSEDEGEKGYFSLYTLWQKDVLLPTFAARIEQAPQTNQKTSQKLLLEEQKREKVEGTPKSILKIISPLKATPKEPPKEPSKKL